MRTQLLGLSVCLLLSGLTTADADAQGALVAPSQSISGSVSDRASRQIVQGERIGVIVMLHDNVDQRRLRASSDVRGQAAVAAQQSRQERVLREALGMGLTRMASDGDLAELYADFPLSGGFAVRANADEINALAAHVDVAAVFEDVHVAPAGLASLQVSDDVPNQPVSLDVLGVHSVWDAGFTGRGQTLAILDSGVAVDHVAFDGAIVAGACFSSTVAGRSQSLCEGGVSQATSLTSGAPAEDCVTVDLDPEAGLLGCGHGTHVAALAAGRKVTFGGRVFSGVAPDADIVAINVFSRFEGEECEEQGGTDYVGCILSWTSDQIAALEWLYENHSQLGTDLINMSFGGGEYFEPCEADPLRPIVQLFASEGVGIFASSGNDDYRNALSGPACIPEVISVANSNSSNYYGQSYDLVSSNKAAFLDIAATGTLLLSAFDVATVPSQGQCQNANSSGGWFGGPILGGDCHYFRYLSGTSMASPTAAGAFALLRQSFPDSNMAELLSAVQLTGNLSSDSLIGRGFASINAGRAFRYLLNDRKILPGIAIEPERAFRATNSTVNINSYTDEIYTLRNTSNAPVSISVIEAPIWLEVSSDSLTIAPGATSELRLAFRKRLHLLPGALFSPDYPFPRINMGHLILGAGDERFELPVSLSAFGVIEADGQYGPFAAFAESGAGARSIYRVSGLYGGQPEAISLVYPNGFEGGALESFVNCSLPVRSERYSGTEYLIVNQDLRECEGLGNAQAYLYLTPRADTDFEHLKVRRFILGGNGSLTDFSLDPNQNVSTAVVDYWSEGNLHNRSSSAELPEMIDPLNRLENARRDDSSVEVVQTSSSFTVNWVGDHNDLMRSSFVIEKLKGGRPYQIKFNIYNPSGDVSQLTPSDYSGNAYYCILDALEERMSWDSYHILPEDYTHCGDFGRANLSIIFFVEHDPSITPLIHISRYVYGSSGAVTDVSWDRRGLYDAPVENDEGDYSVVVRKVFEWVGDSNAPTRNLIRFSPIVGPLRSIDVAISNAVQGSYGGDFDDCTIGIDPTRSSSGDFLLEPSDLRVCGDFVRADLRFRLNGPQEAFGRIVHANRIGLGANGDMTNFSFDEELDKGVSPTRLGTLDRVDFGPFEWVGDAEAGTQGVFRITGLNGVLPTRILVRLANQAANDQVYNDDFHDCELAVMPERSNGGEYLILPVDLSACGAFVRADLHFRIEAPSGSMSGSMLMRRFAVTTAGGLTDFSFDNEIVVRAIGFY